jgi:hypothetical protein
MAAHSLQEMYRRPGFLLKRCHQVSMAIFLHECSEFNLTQSQYGCLRALEVYPSVDQIALARLDRLVQAISVSFRGITDMAGAAAGRTRTRMTKDGVIGLGLWIAERFLGAALQADGETGSPLYGPQASEGEAQHGLFCWTGRFGQGHEHLHRG